MEMEGVKNLDIGPSINTWVSDMRSLHIDTLTRLLSASGERKANFSEKLRKLKSLPPD